MNAFNSDDIWDLHLDQLLVNDHDAICRFLAANAPEDHRPFFAPGLLHDIKQVLKRASDRVLQVELVARAISHVGKADIAATLRAHRGIVAAAEPANASSTPAPRETTDIRAVVVCALAEERDGWFSVLGADVASEQRTATDGNYPYHRVVLDDDKKRKIELLLFANPTMGGEATRGRADAVLREFKPHLLLMSGVCAGRRDAVLMGDLVVADRVFALKGKAYPGHKEKLDITTLQTRDSLIAHAHSMDVASLPAITSAHPAPRQRLLDAVLLHVVEAGAAGISGKDLRAHVESLIPQTTYKAVVDEVEHARKWIELRQTEDGAKRFVATNKGSALVAQHTDRGDDFPRPFEAKPTVHIGPVAVSSAYVRGDMSTEMWAPIVAFERKVLGIEMEGSGLYEAVVAYNEREAGQRRAEVLLAKGVMDYGDDEKDDTAKVYAAELSAAWMLAYLRQCAVRAVLGDENKAK
jgi:nucleoside phosphorylase